MIDAFFIKFDEHAVLNRYNIPYGHTTLGNTCVTGRGGPFATGDSMNQWIQQVRMHIPWNYHRLYNFSLMKTRLSISSQSNHRLHMYM